MTKILTLILALSVVVTSYASGNSLVLPKKPANANEIMVPVGKNGQQVSLMELSHMKVKEFEALSGKKLKLSEKIGFAMAQKQLRKNITADGTLIAGKKFQKAENEKARKYLKLWLILLGVGIILSILGFVAFFFWYFAWLAYLGATIFFILWLISLSGAM